MHPQIVIKSLDQLYQAVADNFRKIINKSILDKGIAHVTLSGGETPMPLFALLTQPEYQNKIPWRLIHFYWADERCVPFGDHESNYWKAKELLFDNVPIRFENLHRIKGELKPEIAVEKYVAELELHRSENFAWPIMDFVLLGMGVDGHTASLFPGRSVTEFKEKTVIFTNAVYNDRPAFRVSLTPRVFNSAKNVVFLVTGKNKAGLIKEILRDNQSQDALPATWIHPTKGSLTWFLDSSAGELINI